MVGKVPVGGGAPITVQSMTITKTADVEGTLQQIYALAAAGCDIVRCTCNEAEAAEGLAQIVPRSPIPIIADIHHQYKMALAAMEAGVHGLRLNPGNIRRPEHIKAAAEARIGVCRSASASTAARSTLRSRSTAASRRRRWWSRHRWRSPT
nr:flavodoxin-dependent (E)-4-hydroxy-3-methylbut-2-enyl-diphosphate synthase [Candidatus Microthrix sp.]